MNKISKRLLSLDAFRGLTIAAMILVNTPGSWSYVYPPLLHAKWHGVTPTDLVFPFFLFIVGVSMSFSFSKFDYNWSSESGRKLIKRMILIFIFGLLLNAFPFYYLDFSTFRIMGVLQRIALAFGFGGVIILLSGGCYKKLLLATLAILLGYWLILLGFGNGDPFSLENNFVRKIDQIVLGSNHLYKGFGIDFDPEGLLSSLPAVATVLIGFLTGRFFKEKTKSEKDILLTVGLGIGLLVAGWLWSFSFPLNKPIWTSSYVLYTAGLATIIFSLFYWLIDVKSYKNWSMFFVVFGINPLFAYVLSVIWVKILIFIVRFNDSAGNMVNGYSWLYENVFVAIAGNMNGSLLFALAHIVFYWAVLYILYKKRIYVKI